MTTDTADDNRLQQIQLMTIDYTRLQPMTKSMTKLMTTAITADYNFDDNFDYNISLDGIAGYVLSDKIV